MSRASMYAIASARLFLTICGLNFTSFGSNGAASAAVRALISGSLCIAASADIATPLLCGLGKVKCTDVMIPNAMSVAGGDAGKSGTTSVTTCTPVANNLASPGERQPRQRHERDRDHDGFVLFAPPHADSCGSDSERQPVAGCAAAAPAHSLLRAI